MPTVAIYDSQGDRVGDHGREHSDRIQRFFFDGVRLALDASGPVTELVVFFRARASAASRSEQYYAVYEGPVGAFGRTLTRTVEGEYGLSIVTSTDDTAVYELFERDAMEDPPNTSGLKRVITRLRGGPGATSAGPGQVRVGVGSYERASQVVRHARQTEDVERVAIAENADSPRLDPYDLVVEKGDHTGVVLLDGDHDRRAAPGPAGTADGESSGGGSRRRRLAGIGAVVLVALVGGVALVGVPFLDGGGATLGVDSAELRGADGVVVEGSLTGGLDASDEQFRVHIWERPGDGRVDRDSADPVVTVQDPRVVEAGADRFSLQVDAATLETARSEFDFLGETGYVVDVVTEGGHERASATLNRAAVRLDLTGAAWSDAGPSVTVTGELTQGDAPVGVDAPTLDVTLDPATGGADTVGVTAERVEGSTVEFSVRDDETTVDLAATETLTVSASLGDATGTVEVSPGADGLARDPAPG